MSTAPPLSLDEQMGMMVDSEGKISPATFPEPSAYPGSIEIYASNLRTAGEQVSGLGDDIKSAWGGLTSCYQAPEAGELYSVLDPVATDGNTVQRAMNRAATALDNFAEDLTSIKSRWSSLRTEAWDLRARMAEKGDEWRDAEGWKGLIGVGESPLVEENDNLIEKGFRIIEDYAEAELTCANAINLFVPDRTRFEKAGADSDSLDPNVFYHGFEQDLSELATEWGIEGATTDEHWWVDAGAAVWDFGVGAVEGLGAAVGAHSSEGWFSMSWDDALMENWEGTLQSVASLAGVYDAESDSYGWAGWDTVGEAWKDAAHAVVPWEEWGERPGYVIGTALLNIGVTVAGVALSATGVGAAVGVPLLAWRGASILNKMSGSRLPDMDLPSGDSPSPISIQLNLPNFAGGNRTLFEFDLSGFGGVDPRRIQDMQDALARFAERNGGVDGTGDSGSPTGSRPRTGDDTSTADENRRTSQHPGYTVEDFRDGMTVEDVFNPVSPEATALRDRYGADFRRTDAEQGGDRDNWEGSGDGNDGRELQYAEIGRSPDHLENSATPDTPQNRRADASSSDPDFDAPDDFRPDGPEMADRSPTVTNSVDNDTRPGDSPANGNDGPNNSHVDQGSGSTTVATGGGNGTGPTGGPGSGLPGDGDSEPLDPNRRDAHTRAVRTQEVIDELGLGNGVRPPDFNERFVDLLNQRPDLFNEFYDRGGSRRSVEFAIEGIKLPILTRVGDNGEWLPKSNLSEPDPPEYLTSNPNRIEVGDDPNHPDALRLNDLAEQRRTAIDDAKTAREKYESLRNEIGDRDPEVQRLRQVYEDVRAQHGGVEKHPDVKRARIEYESLRNEQGNLDPEVQRRHEAKNTLLGESSRASETFGEEVARQIVREKFDGNTTITLDDGTPLELPRVIREIKPTTYPGHGNSQFDQIHLAEGPNGKPMFVVMEAKSSLTTDLGERTIPPPAGSNSPPTRVSQGSRPYFGDILEAMKERGRKAIQKRPEDSKNPLNELNLAEELEDALDDARVLYVEAKGDPRGPEYGGGAFRLFDIGEENP
ncbi:hypothetical protein [Nocardiopsis sp. YSL2]|uniref:hypothetical protein n=1 Tax=Nocardiopsis sp. YSL2 TaxID=2939492 RepID=UPI0026F430B8|nr:hypothetical protein [Nocardiopsis sp. YSL2]